MQVSFLDLLYLAAWGIALYIVHFYVNVFSERKKGPPGPIPVPILGNLVQVAQASSVPSQALTKLADQYGEIFLLRMGPKKLVILASVESINTVFNRPEAQCRDLSGTFYDRNMGQNLGIIFGEGPQWEKTKVWAIRCLREYGFGKSATMESSIMDEVTLLCQKIDKTRKENNNIVSCTGLFVLPVFKIIWQMISGGYTSEDIKTMRVVLEKSEKAISKGVFGVGIVSAFPFARFLAPEITGQNAWMEFYNEARAVAKDLLHSTQLSVEKHGMSSPQNLVEAFVYKMKEERGKPGTIFTEDNFVIIYMDLLQAGSDTNSAYLESCLLFFILYPDVQQKVYDEIMEFGGNVGAKEREKMVYTQALMWEVHRHGKVVQNLVTRRVSDDINYKGYIIKKGTFMLANLHNAYFNEDIWEDPYAFRPERFIGKDGQLQKLNNLMPFGLGKRLCPGELVSHVTGFLYITAILKKYKLSVVPGQPLPSSNLAEGLTSRPLPFEILFTERCSSGA